MYSYSCFILVACGFVVLQCPLKDGLKVRAEDSETKDNLAAELKIAFCRVYFPVLGQSQQYNLMIAYVYAKSHYPLGNFGSFQFSHIHLNHQTTKVITAIMPGVRWV